VTAELSSFLPVSTFDVALHFLAVEELSPRRHYLCAGIYTQSGTQLNFHDLANASGEVLDLEWFRQNKHAVFEAAAPNNSILRIASDEQHFQVRPDNACGVGTCLPFIPPGRPTSLINRSILAFDSRTRSPATPSCASITA
jgi:hypothetical protein